MNLSDSYILSYKHYGKLKKALNDEVILMSLVPPNYSSLKVFEKGGALYKEACMKRWEYCLEIKY